jgi:hypothetical protein
MQLLTAVVAARLGPELPYTVEIGPQGAPRPCPDTGGRLCLASERVVVSAAALDAPWEAWTAPLPAHATRRSS